MLPLFAPKQTFARIDYLQQGGRLVGKKTLIMLNFLPKSRQKTIAAYIYIKQDCFDNKPDGLPKHIEKSRLLEFSKLILIPNWHIYYCVCVN